MRLKVIDGVLYFTADFSTPKGFQAWVKIERWSKTYLKFFLGMAIVALAWAWSNALQQTDYQALRDYAVQYMNTNK